MKFNKRIEALESRLIKDPLILYRPDGSTSVLHGGRDILVRLLQSVCRRADLSPEQAAQWDLIRQSTRAQEPGGGRMLELIKCILHAQAVARDSVA